MFDFIRNVSSTTQSQKQSDMFAGCSTAQDMTDAFTKELSKAISDSQDVKPYIVSPDACQGVFARMDTSQDGNLSHDEAIKALMPVVDDPDIAERIYGILDPTGQGQISQDRFNQCLDAVIKVTSYEAHLSVTEVTQMSGGQGSDANSFEGAVDDLRNQDGISGKKVSAGAANMGEDAFWMKLMDELDKSRAGQSNSASQDGATAQVSATATGQAMTMQSMTYAEASISVETVSANLGAVFSAVA